jgi:hypothetical protein
MKYFALILSLSYHLLLYLVFVALVALVALVAIVAYVADVLFYQKRWQQVSMNRFLQQAAYSLPSRRGNGLSFPRGPCNKFDARPLHFAHR